MIALHPWIRVIDAVAIAKRRGLVIRYRRPRKPAPTPPAAA